MTFIFVFKKNFDLDSKKYKKDVVLWLSKMEGVHSVGETYRTHKQTKKQCVTH